MSASSKIPAKHVLRGILRRLKAHKGELPEAHQQPGQSTTVSYALERYRDGSSDETDASRNQELQKMAYEFMILRQDIDERCRLQRLDAGAENQLSPHEMSRRAAARAGLALPKLNPDLPE